MDEKLQMRVQLFIQNVSFGDRQSCIRFLALLLAEKPLSFSFLTCKTEKTTTTLQGVYVLMIILVFCCCLNKLPKIQWLTIYKFTIATLEVRLLKMGLMGLLRQQRACVPFRGPRGEFTSCLFLFLETAHILWVHGLLPAMASLQLLLLLSYFLLTLMVPPPSFKDCCEIIHSDNPG